MKIMKSCKENNKTIMYNINGIHTGARGNVNKTLIVTISHCVVLYSIRCIQNWHYLNRNDKIITSTEPSLIILMSYQISCDREITIQITSYTRWGGEKKYGGYTCKILMMYLIKQPTLYTTQNPCCTNSFLFVA